MPRRSNAAFAATLSIAFTAGLAQANPTFSRDINANADATFDTAQFGEGGQIVRPAKYRAVTFNTNELRAHLSAAPTAAQARLGVDKPTVALPMPDGSMATFEVTDAPVMAPALAQRFPEIRTYIATNADDPTITARLSITPHGVRAQVRQTATASSKGTWYIDPLVIGNDEAHASYWRNDLTDAPPFSCGVTDEDVADLKVDIDPTAATESDVVLRTYRLAVTTTNEYSAFFGGTVAGALAGIVEAVNRITGIYESDLGVRFELVPNNDLLVFTTNDPFSSVSLSAVDNFIDQTIGSSNYDVGHLVDTGGGGFASLGVVCSSSKGRGYTGLTPPTGDPFYVDYFAHELGHQFAGTHTFNGVNGACTGGNRTGSTAWEPGSATTIMGYAGICGADNTQGNSDPVFHGGSILQMRSFILNNTCPVITSPGNATPSVEAGPSLVLPTQTPFALTATASDDGPTDALTYAWEQFDLGPARSLAASDNGQSPLFRSFDVNTSPTRYFPELFRVVNNAPTNNEKLPTVNRNAEFGVTVRDNFPGGGATAFDDVNIQFTTNAGPFTVTQPNGGANFTDTINVSWNRAGTQNSPVNESNVKVLLSTDGGQTFPITLTESTPNDGNATVDVPPGIDTNDARVMVMGVTNPFFNVNPGDFTVVSASGCNLADISVPFGFLDLSDTDAFIAGYLASDTIADIAAPFGFLDLSDVDAFIAAFTAGCP
ncbi:MAG: reprolysin-like metallopeptidase [Planctomycetota bacterium]